MKNAKHVQDPLQEEVKVVVEIEVEVGMRVVEIEVEVVEVEVGMKVGVVRAGHNMSSNPPAPELREGRSGSASSLRNRKARWLQMRAKRRTNFKREAGGAGDPLSMTKRNHPAGNARRVNTNTHNNTKESAANRVTVDQRDMNSGGRNEKWETKEKAEEEADLMTTNNMALEEGTGNPGMRDLERIGVTEVASVVPEETLRDPTAKRRQVATLSDSAGIALLLHIKAGEEEVERRSKGHAETRSGPTARAGQVETPSDSAEIAHLNKEGEEVAGILRRNATTRRRNKLTSLQHTHFQQRCLFPAFMNC